MKKGQGNSRRREIEETLYGIRLSGDILKHLRLLSEMDCWTALIKNPFPSSEIKWMKKRLIELDRLVLDSWKVIRYQPEALRKLAIVAEKDVFAATYPDEFAMLALVQQERAMGSEEHTSELQSL